MMSERNRKLDSAHGLRLFVRRGALRRFDKLKRSTADLSVSVEWDRRQALVPGAPEGDRRRTPPFTWQAADFVVVDPAAEPTKD